MQNTIERASRLAIDPPRMSQNLAESFQEHKRARTILINYLTHKLEICDWHGVRDAAVDIEILEAKYNIP